MLHCCIATTVVPEPAICEDLDLHVAIFMDCIEIATVWRIAGVNEPTWYNGTHNYANNSRNISHQKNRRCESSFRS